MATEGFDHEPKREIRIKKYFFEQVMVGDVAASSVSDSAVMELGEEEEEGYANGVDLLFFLNRKRQNSS